MSINNLFFSSSRFFTRNIPHPKVQTVQECCHPGWTGQEPAEPPPLPRPFSIFVFCFVLISKEFLPLFTFICFSALSSPRSFRRSFWNRRRNTMELAFVWVCLTRWRWLGPANLEQLRVGEPVLDLMMAWTTMVITNGRKQDPHSFVNRYRIAQVGPGLGLGPCIW